MALSVKDAVYKIQTTLLDGVKTEAQLHAAANLLSKSDYEDVVTERNIINLCGYPLCSNKLPESEEEQQQRKRKGRYRISLKDHKVYDLQETWLYCSTPCLIHSRTFSDCLLPTDRNADATLESNSDRILHILEAVGSLSLDEAHTGNVPETPKIVPEPPKIVPERPQENNVLEEFKEGKKNENNNNSEEKFSSKLLIHEQENDSSEKSEAAFDSASAGPSDAIEGYVPRGEQRRLNIKPPADESISKSNKKKGPKKSKNTLKRGVPKNESDFHSTIIIGEPHADVASHGTTSSIGIREASLNQKDKKSEGKLDLQNENKSEVLKLRSALKTRGVKQLNRSVTWADEKKLEQSDHIEDPEKRILDNSNKSSILALPSLESMSQSVTFSKDAESLESFRAEFNEENVKASRLEAAEAFANALTEAANAVASGEVDANEAAFRAGICIVPGTDDQDPQKTQIDVEKLGSTQPVWTNLPSTADEEAYNAQECWFDDPPDGFSLELSPFATTWIALDQWITRSSVAHLYGRDDSDADDFSTVNGRGYPHKIVSGGGLSTEIERTVGSCISRALPGVVQSLRLPTPISSLEQALGRFLNTMTFIDAIPPFRTNQWRVIVILFLDALSVHRIPSLGSQIMNKRSLILKVLEAAEMTYEEYKIMEDLLIPLGRCPRFSSQSGG